MLATPRILIISALTGIMLVGAHGVHAATVTRGPYLMMGTPDSMVVRWRTDVATNTRVQFGTAQGSLTGVVDNATSTTEHEVRLTGLSPNTKYFYSVGSTTGVLSGNDANTFFKTSPTAGTAQATRIWVIGDAGTGAAVQTSVYNAYMGLTGSTYTNLWLMLGDNAYSSGTDAEYSSKMFNNYGLLFRQSPLWPTIGNHDAASADSATQTGPYYQQFTMPKNAEAGGVASGTEAYYSFNHGNIHFIVLDSQETSRSTTGAMMNWMKADLQADNSDWTIAFWHHPPYTKGSHDSDTESNLIDMRQNFLPVLEAHGVDLVLTGHSHSYERSFLLDGHYGTSSTFNSSYLKNGGNGRTDGTGAYTKSSGNVAHEGAVYSVVGSSGQTSGGTLNHPAMYISLNEAGSMVLDINGQTLNARFINSTGGIRDYFTIDKSGTAPPATVTVTLQNGSNGYAGNDDTYVSSGQSASNFGSATTLHNDLNDASGGNEYSLLKWNVSSIPATATLQSVKLGLNVSNASAGTYNLHQYTQAWSEGSATWANQAPDSHLGTLVGTLTATATGNATVTLNAAGVSMVQGWVNGSGVNNGLVLKSAGTTDGLDFRSSEYSTVASRPMLTIQYTP